MEVCLKGAGQAEFPARHSAKLPESLRYVMLCRGGEGLCVARNTQPGFLSAGPIAVHEVALTASLPMAR
ncbi:hypothetical protein MESS4_780024 [Mesorhizobium sp. STM 4661]|nr:hypothetical protein MESS4_780024 [Mesorhizobium sp. STM 4661]